MSAVTNVIVGTVAVALAGGLTYTGFSVGNIIKENKSLTEQVTEITKKNETLQNENEQITIRFDSNLAKLQEENEELKTRLENILGKDINNYSLSLSNGLSSIQHENAEFTFSYSLESLGFDKYVAKECYQFQYDESSGNCSTTIKEYNLGRIDFSEFDENSTYALIFGLKDNKTMRINLKKLDGTTNTLGYALSYAITGNDLDMMFTDLTIMPNSYISGSSIDNLNNVESTESTLLFRVRDYMVNGVNTTFNDLINNIESISITKVSESEDIQDFANLTKTFDNGIYSEIEHSFYASKYFSASGVDINQDFPNIFNLRFNTALTYTFAAKYYEFDLGKVNFENTSTDITYGAKIKFKSNISQDYELQVVDNFIFGVNKALLEKAGINRELTTEELFVFSDIIILPNCYIVGYGNIPDYDATYDFLGGESTHSYLAIRDKTFAVGDKTYSTEDIESITISELR